MPVCLLLVVEVFSPVTRQPDQTDAQQKQRCRLGNRCGIGILSRRVNLGYMTASDSIGCNRAETVPGNDIVLSPIMVAEIGIGFYGTFYVLFDIKGFGITSIRVLVRRLGNELFKFMLENFRWGA